MDREQSTEDRSEERQDQPQDMEHRSEDSGDEQEARGADSPAEKATKGGDGDVTEAERESEEVKERVRKLEEDPPERLEDWPQDEAKYETFGGPEGEHGYHEGPEQKLGPSALRHREDGSVEIEGEEVDNPEDYKTEPVPGGPTDPDTPNLRMDKASPDDVSDVAKKAAEKKGGEKGQSEDEGS